MSKGIRRSHSRIMPANLALTEYEYESFEF